MRRLSEVVATIAAAAALALTTVSAQEAGALAQLNHGPAGLERIPLRPKARHVVEVLKRQEATPTPAPAKDANVSVAAAEAGQPTFTLTLNATATETQMMTMMVTMTATETKTEVQIETVTETVKEAAQNLTQATVTVAATFEKTVTVAATFDRTVTYQQLSLLRPRLLVRSRCSRGGVHNSSVDDNGPRSTSAGR
ncbi:hypothetical protein GTA08_BOTSDO02559 [Neofusicoccum parvum]|uniref:Uncharacterized protein n=1 Tax=Neofusicoccum parvum TaxID=310453 RepID=A0ACB5RP67_9PEZI|nr:hypothetical protein GTA08_BOTSDO02559 [Neofusicoccum parvum]